MTLTNLRNSMEWALLVALVLGGGVRRAGPKRSGGTSERQAAGQDRADRSCRPAVRTADVVVDDNGRWQLRSAQPEHAQALDRHAGRTGDA